jgi:hypothetical protein
MAAAILSGRSIDRFTDRFFTDRFTVQVALGSADRKTVRMTGRTAHRGQYRCKLRFPTHSTL